MHQMQPCVAVQRPVENMWQKPIKMKQLVRLVVIALVEQMFRTDQLVGVRNVALVRTMRARAVVRLVHVLNVVLVHIMVILVAAHQVRA